MSCIHFHIHIYVYRKMSSRSTTFRWIRKDVERLYRSRGILPATSHSPITSSNDIGTDESLTETMETVESSCDTMYAETANETDSNETMKEPEDERNFLPAITIDGSTDQEQIESENDEENVGTQEDCGTAVEIGPRMLTWHLQYNISESATNDLLYFLKEHYFPHLPKNIETLKLCSRHSELNIERMNDGEYCFFGLKNMLQCILSKIDDFKDMTNHYQLQFGIDGIPLTKSSRSSLWLILLKIKSFPLVLPVAVYHGTGKPKNVHDYMRDFIAELDLLLRDGILFNDRRITFSVCSFVMDAQAKSYVMNIKACMQ